MDCEWCEMAAMAGDCGNADDADADGADIVGIVCALGVYAKVGGGVRGGGVDGMPPGVEAEAYGTCWNRDGVVKFAASEASSPSKKCGGGVGGMMKEVVVVPATKVASGERRTASGERRAEGVVVAVVVVAVLGERDRDRLEDLDLLDAFVGADNMVEEEEEEEEVDRVTLPAGVAGRSVLVFVMTRSRDDRRSDPGRRASELAFRFTDNILCSIT